MHLETIDFPSDKEGQMGNLYKALTNALQRASESPEVAELMGKVLAFSTKQLKVAKDDYKAVQKRRQVLADRAMAAELEAIRKKNELRYGKVSTEITELTEEQIALATELGLTEDASDG